MMRDITPTSMPDGELFKMYAARGDVRAVKVNETFQVAGHVFVSPDGYLVVSPGGKVLAIDTVTFEALFAPVAKLRGDSGRPWAVEIMAAWQRAYGGMLQPGSLKVVKPLVLANGIKEVLAAFERYRRDTPDGRFASLRRFVETYGRYADKPARPKAERYVKLTDRPC